MIGKEKPRKKAIGQAGGKPRAEISSRKIARAARLMITGQMSGDTAGKQRE